MSDESAVEVRPETTLRTVAYLFAEYDATDALVIGPGGDVLGTVGIRDLLSARLHDLTEEHHRSRTLLNRRPSGG